MNNDTAMNTQPNKETFLTRDDLFSRLLRFLLILIVALFVDLICLPRPVYAHRRLSRQAAPIQRDAVPPSEANVSI